MTTIEEGGALYNGPLQESESATEGNLVGEKFERVTKVGQVQAQTDPSSGMLEVPIPIPQSTFMKQEAVSSRPTSAGKASSKGSSNWNQSVMVEEEVPTWLQQYGAV